MKRKIIALATIFALNITIIAAAKYVDLDERRMNAPAILGRVDGYEFTAEPVEWQVYGYNYLDGEQCGKDVADGITASGELARHGKTCAAPKGVPFGTRLYIEGYGVVTVNDRGAFGENVLDVAFDNNASCYKITGTYTVYVLAWEGEL